ncbi:MAG: ROK family protein [Fimbriimonadaceae bacterium]|nr:ROK family protein [Fimbriimonadaceae bacterium]
MDRSAPYVAGVDIGGTFIKVGILSPDGFVVHRTQLESQADRGFAHFVTRIGDALQQALAEPGLSAAQLRGIGVGYPGTVYPDTGLISGSPNIPGSQGSNLVTPLEERFQRAVLPINDASAAALGECRFGAGPEHGARDLALFTLGTGVGGGVVLNHRLHYGAHHQGTELGHMVVDPHGPQCGCGNFGCLEAFCGTAGILRAAWKRLQTGRPSRLWDYIQPFSGRELTPKMISQAAAAGDAVALEVWGEIGFWLGVGCVTVINYQDPDLIVIGGQIAKAGPPLFDAIRQTVRARQRLNPWPVDKIVPAKLGEDAGIVGAAAVVLSD